MILGKVGIEGMEGLDEIGFDGFELYVKLDSDLDHLPKVKNIRVVHQPKLIHSEGVYLPFNLADNSVEGYFSEKALERTVEYALKVGARRVVTHGGFIDRTILDMEEGQEIVAKRINMIHHPEVLICLENDPLWSTNMWINEAVLIDQKDFVETLKHIEVPVGVCVDIEHLYRSAILLEFYHKYEDEFRELKYEEDYDKLIEQVDLQFIGFVSNSPKDIQKKIKEFVEGFFTALKPYIRQVHVCGFDYRQDRTKYRDQILPGAHLPLKYQGKSGTVDVMDRVDHEQYLKYVKNTDIDIVLEFNNRKDYNYLIELRKSLSYLRGCLK